MRTAAAPLLLVVATLSVAAAQEPTLDEVLARAAVYVADYQRRLQGIVAEETYAQNLITNTAGRSTAGVGRARMTREGRQLKSDVLLVKLGDDDWWLQFRDVFEVDRKPVRDRDERLSKLFINAKPDARAQAEIIQKESARYNLGPVTRTINIPIMALLFLERVNQPNVQFTRVKTGNVKRLEALADAAAIWQIEFNEISKRTMVRGANNRDIPTHGRIWIDSGTGRVLRTEITTQDTDLRAMVDVTYKTEPGLDFLVPGEMRETYNVRSSEARIDGRATYSHFRQFSVSTTEKPKP